MAIICNHFVSLPVRGSCLYLGGVGSLSRVCAQGPVCLIIRPWHQGMYAVCYLRQCSMLSVVCINWGDWGDSGSVRSVYVYVLEAAKLPCVLIAVLWLPCYYYVVSVCRVLCKSQSRRATDELLFSEGGWVAGGSVHERKSVCGMLTIDSWLIH